jgi:hypothetical protein
MARNVAAERLLNVIRRATQVTDQLRDIREFVGDADAYRDELYRRWTGLLSYR